MNVQLVARDAVTAQSARDTECMLSDGQLSVVEQVRRRAAQCAQAISSRFAPGAGRLPLAAEGQQHVHMRDTKWRSVPTQPGVLLRRPRGAQLAALSRRRLVFQLRCQRGAHLTRHAAQRAHRRPFTCTSIRHQRSRLQGGCALQQDVDDRGLPEGMEDILDSIPFDFEINLSSDDEESADVDSTLAAAAALADGSHPIAQGHVPTLFVGDCYTNGAVNALGVHKMQRLVEDMYHSLMYNRQSRPTVELLLRAHLPATCSGAKKQGFVVHNRASDARAIAAEALTCLYMLALVLCNSVLVGRVVLTFIIMTSRR